MGETDTQPVVLRLRTERRQTGGWRQLKGKKQRSFSSKEAFLKVQYVARKGAWNSSILHLLSHSREIVISCDIFSVCAAWDK